ncbi:MAG TPA: DNA helicase UvrD [Candidatus Desulfofervidus auxilii]|uniref:DNA helicase UvrD n=1 Tax=Desulfofervidus auxilii TaxID=1621989 RepID=A0A7V0I9P9_DESA2|nr:DNA helicase UvrD [Candidatus Desulfofervidus auxilii]
MFIADLHIHSKYSRATSKDMEINVLYKWAKQKGIKVLGTGDFTHPHYLTELKKELEPLGNGLFKLRNGDDAVYFMLTTEISNIFSVKGKGRRIHTLIFAPSFEVVDKINIWLGRRGDLMVDGRPTFGFHVKELVKIVLDISEDCLIVPAHAWTPWYGILGSNGGFDSLEEAFEEEVKHIYAIETGLSSDAKMNWRLSVLDKITLISNSDAHSPHRIGREANVFNCDCDYYEIIDAIKKKDKNRFLCTIEFYPEEGKYHYDGHRKCNVLFSPQETKKHNYICPVCGQTVTIGVMHRVETLADRPEGYRPKGAIPEIHLIPLEEIIAEAMGRQVATKGVQDEYERLVKHATEFDILLKLSIEELSNFVPSNILEGIIRVREGNVFIRPGFDGVYGEIKIFPKSEKKEKRTFPKQLGLFQK